MNPARKTDADPVKSGAEVPTLSSQVGPKYSHEPGSIDKAARKLHEQCLESPFYREAQVLRLPGLMTALQLATLERVDMADYVHNLAYRHMNGEVEGFKGTGGTPKQAEMVARRKAYNKAEAIGEGFDPMRIIVSEKGLTPEELAQVKRDWVIDK